jgi:chromosome segregation ATPase
MSNPFSDKEKEEIYNYQQDNNENQNYPKENNNQIENLQDFPSGKNDINNQNINEINLNYDNYDSDIDDPKYRPNSDLFLNHGGNGIIYDEKINNNYIPNNFNTFSNHINKTNLNFMKLNNPLNCFKFHNYDNINFNQDNLCQNKSVFELQTENNLLKNELYKKAQIIKNKDEIISEFQSLITTFKTKFDQYEAKNHQLKQQIIILEKQLNSKNNDIILNSNKKDTNIDINNNIFYKQQIKELETDYDSKIKKLNEKFKEKENLLKKEKNEEFLRVSKNLEEKKFENEKLKSKISNYKIEINTLKSQIENNDYEKNSIMDQKDKENSKLKEKITEKDKEITEIENDYREKISKLEEQINLIKEENNNLLNEINENQDKENEYETEILNLKNNNDIINNELNQINIALQNKDVVIDQLKQQIEELNNLLIQSEEDLKNFEENKQQEFAEYSNQIELLIQEKNILQTQNIELTDNLSLANENLKKFNDLLSDKYSNIETELMKQANRNDNLEKKYKGALKQLKNKQNILNQENSQLKEIINNNNLNKEQIDINNQNKIQNLSLYNKVTGNKNEISQINDNIINMNVSSNNYINNDSQDINNNMNFNNNLNYTYNYTNTSYVDPKEVGQKRTLNEFKMLLNRIDEKLDMS